MNLTITPRVSNHNQYSPSFKMKVKLEGPWGTDLTDKILGISRKEFDEFGMDTDQLWAKIEDSKTTSGIGEDDCISYRRHTPVTISSVIDGELQSPQAHELSEFENFKDFFLWELKKLKQKFPHKVNLQK